DAVDCASRSAVAAIAMTPFIRLWTDGLAFRLSTVTWNCYDAAHMEQKVRRRDMLLGGLGLSLVAISSGRADAQDDPAAVRPKPGDLLVRDGDADKKPLTLADIVADAKPTVAWAMD